jgi:hypothetical protein
MKKRMYLVIPIIAAYLIVVLSGSAKKEISEDKAFEALSHTWVSTDKYMPGHPQKAVVSPDGKVIYYQQYDDPSPTMPGTLTLTEAWTDREGNIWFKASHKWSTETIYLLNKISDSGKMWEYVWSYTDLPDDIEPDSPKYIVRYRQ